MRRSAFAVFLLTPLILLSGCSIPLQLQVRDPDPKAIIDYVSIFGPYSPGPIKTGGDYVWAGYAYVDHHCSKFFEALEEGRMNMAFLRDTSAAGFSAANTVLTLAKVSQQSIGVVGAGGTLLAATLTAATNDYFYGQFSGLAQYSGSLWLQTSAAQDNFKNKDPTVHARYAQIADQPLGTLKVQAMAHNIVQSYASLCTIQQMQVFIQTALANGKAVPAADKTAGTGLKGRSLGGPTRGGMTGYVIQ